MFTVSSFRDENIERDGDTNKLEEKWKLRLNKPVVIRQLGGTNKIVKLGTLVEENVKAVFIKSNLNINLEQAEWCYLDTEKGFVVLDHENVSISPIERKSLIKDLIEKIPCNVDNILKIYNKKEVLEWFNGDKIELFPRPYDFNFKGFEHNYITGTVTERVAKSEVLEIVY